MEKTNIIKKTYSSPILQRLGAVIDLTTGGSGHHGHHGHRRKKRRRRGHRGHR